MHLHMPRIRRAMLTLGFMGIVGAIMLFVLLAGTVALLTWKTFELVTAMPDRIIRWVGQTVANLGSEASQAQGQDVIGLSKGSGHQISGAAGTLAAGGSLKSIYAKDKQGYAGGGNQEAPLAAGDVAGKDTIKKGNV